MKTEESTVTVMCCFCGDGIEYSSAVLLSIKPRPDAEEEQGFFCHPKCLDKLLHSSVSSYHDLLTSESK